MRRADAKVAALRTRGLPGRRCPCLRVDATYVPRCKGDHSVTAVVGTVQGRGPLRYFPLRNPLQKGKA